MRCFAINLQFFRQKVTAIVSEIGILTREGLGLWFPLENNLTLRGETKN
jgi:hypothetical protein